MSSRGTARERSPLVSVVRTLTGSGLTLLILFNLNYSHTLFFFFKILFIFREEESEKERGKHQCVVASHMLPIGDLACNPGTCPDWESNQQPFGLQGGTQSTEAHQLGCIHALNSPTAVKAPTWGLKRGHNSVHSMRHQYPLFS